MTAAPNECPAGGPHIFNWYESEVSVGGPPAGVYCVECGAEPNSKEES